MKKIGFGEGGAKGFFARHVEKMVLGVVMLLVIFFIYSGYSVKGVSKSPDQLKQEATSVASHISADSWKEIMESRLPPDDQQSRVDRVLRATDANQYSVNPLTPPLFRQQAKRSDPELYAPIKVRAKAVFGAVAMQAKEGEVDPLGEVVAEGEGAGAGGENILGAPRVRDRGVGYRPQGDAIAKGKYFATITALVPLRKQAEEYERCFLNADGYDNGGMRDRPTYELFWVERAEVKEGEAELQWKPLNLIHAMNDYYRKNWTDSPPDLAAVEYVHPKLTIPPVPLLNEPLASLLLPPEIPEYTAEGQMPAEETQETEPSVIEIDPFNTRGGGDPSELGGVGPARPRGRPVGGPHRGGEGSLGPTSEEQVDYQLLRFYDFTIVPGKRYQYRVKVQLSDPNDPDTGSTVVANQGSPRGSQGGNSSSSGAPPDHVLDTDVISRIENKQAAYAQVAIERSRASMNLDDNFQWAIYWYKRAVSAGAAKNPATSAAVQALNADLLKAGVSQGKLSVKPEETLSVHFRESDWSDPSNVVIGTKANQVLAGNVKPAHVIPIPGTNAVIPLDEVQGKVMTVEWDSDKAVNVPGVAEVKRGSVLNFVEDAKVSHPITHEWKTLTDYGFNTNMVVLDIQGGDELPAEKKQEEPLTTPGEFLLLDASGNLLARNELDDLTKFEDFTPPKTVEPGENTRPGDLPDPLDPRFLTPPEDPGFGGLLELEQGGGRERTPRRRNQRNR